MKRTAENSTSPATKAPSASSRRAVRAVINDSRLAETGDQSGADHLEKNGGAVMRPQRDGAGQDGAHGAAGRAGPPPGPPAASTTAARRGATASEIEISSGMSFT